MRESTSRAGGPARLLSLVVAGSLVLAACGGSAGAASPPGPSSTSAANPTESPLSSTPTDSTAADRTNVSGRMGGDGLYKEDEATSRLYFEFTYTMSDPRVSGTEKIDCTERFFDLPDLGLGAGVGVWWDCSSVLTGQGGTWKAVTGYGSEYMKDNRLRTNGVNLYEGQGAFAGLRYVTLFSSSPELDVAVPGEGYVIAGWIEPVE